MLLMLRLLHAILIIIRSYHVEVRAQIIIIIMKYIPAEKKTIETCPKHDRKCNDLMVIMGIVLVLMETKMVCTDMWWIILVGC